MTKFNEDELHAPDWMNKDFFNDVLRKHEKNDSVVVRDVKMSPASVQGDHYASVMFRAVVTYDSNQTKGISKSLIIKTMPEYEGNKMDLLGETAIFDTEISMYENTIPKFEAELRKIGDNTVLGASALYFSMKPKQIIIFEDICPKGYEVIRNRDVTLEEAKEAFLKLAKWHAVSYKLAAEGDSSVTDYKESFLNFKDVETMPFIASGMDNFIELIGTLDEFKSYVPKLRIVQKDLVKRCINSTLAFREKSPVGVHVLCHGDFHRKNMMFKHNSKGELEDVMLLDFQVCYFGPAILDVIYGIYMLVDAEARKNHFDEIIHFYSTSFIETLKKLKFQGDLPKITDFFIELLRHNQFEIFLLTSFLPLWYAMSEGETNPDALMSENEVRRKAYYNSGYVAEVKRIFPIMLHKGYFY